MNDNLKISMSLEETLKARRSVRGFLKKQVPETVIHKAFELARLSPSNSNIQPWWIYVASGKTRDTIQKKLYDQMKNKVTSHPDFQYPQKFHGVYRERQVDCGLTLYSEMKIERDDREGRINALLRNFQFFDAPHMAFICMEKDFPQTVAVDVGIYAQTLMLAFTALGVSTCAMGSMREHPNIAKEVFNIDDNLGILFGIAFGYEDVEVPANKTRMARVSFQSYVSFLN